MQIVHCSFSIQFIYLLLLVSKCHQIPILFNELPSIAMTVSSDTQNYPDSFSSLRCLFKIFLTFLIILWALFAGQWFVLVLSFTSFALTLKFSHLFQGALICLCGLHWAPSLVCRLISFHLGSETLSGLSLLCLWGSTSYFSWGIASYRGPLCPHILASFWGLASCRELLYPPCADVIFIPLGVWCSVPGLHLCEKPLHHAGL